jgi:hypothetical protein
MWVSRGSAFDRLATMGSTRSETFGEAVPRCNARLRTGGRCEAFPALHPQSTAHYVLSGRCLAHGGASTGPRTPAGKATVSEALRQRWVALFEAEGKVRPSETMRARVGAYLEARTWEEAMAATRLSRRTLLRIEGGAYCSEAELSEVRRVLGLYESEETGDPWTLGEAG